MSMMQNRARVVGACLSLVAFGGCGGEPRNPAPVEKKVNAPTIAFEKLKNLKDLLEESFFVEAHVRAIGNLPAARIANGNQEAVVFKQLYRLSDPTNKDSESIVVFYFGNPPQNGFAKVLCSAVQLGKNTRIYVHEFIQE